MAINKEQKRGIIKRIIDKVKSLRKETKPLLKKETKPLIKPFVPREFPEKVKIEKKESDDALKKRMKSVDWKKWGP